MTDQISFACDEPALLAELLNAFRDVTLPHHISYLVVSAVHHDALHAQRNLQARYDELGAHHLPLLWTACDVWIGPVLAPNARGCALCLGRWLRQPDLPDQGGTVQRFDSPASAIRLPILRSLAARHAAQLAGADTGHDGDTHPSRAVVHFDTRPIAVRQHHFLPHPHCPRCGIDRAASAPIVALTDAGGASLRGDNQAIELATLRDRYFDVECGLVKRVGTIDSALTPMAAAIFIQDRGRNELQTGIGRTGSRRGSEQVAILEALERFAGSQAVAGHPAAIGPYRPRSAMVAPESFILHDPAQIDEPGFTLARYDPDMPVAWVPARNLTTGAEQLIPEQFVYYGRDPAASHQLNRYVFEISNGCALGSDPAEAALHGLFEVIERDAFLCLWYLQKTPPEIDLDSIDDCELALIRARIEGEGFELRAFDASTIRSICAVVIAISDPASDTPFAGICASGAHRDPIAALKGALVEAASSFTTVQRDAMGAARATALTMLGNDSLVQVMDDHMLLYSSPEAQQRLDFLLHNRPRQAFADLFGDAPMPCGSSAALAETVRELDALGYQPLVVDQSFDLLAASGLHCVKTLVPGMLPMTFGHQYRRVSHARLAQVAGCATVAINPRPHNFP